MIWIYEKQWAPTQVPTAIYGIQELSTVRFVLGLYPLSDLYRY